MSFTLTRFLDPKTDVVFKKIFGNNPDLIKGFLNNVLPLPSDGLIVIHDAHKAGKAEGLAAGERLAKHEIANLEITGLNIQDL